VGTSAARTRTWSWDSESNRISNESLAGVSETTYTYAASGRIASETTTDVASGQKRTTTYAYTTHSNGLLATMTVDGPLSSDTVVYSYSAAGDLLQVRNASGHATTYAGHNALGQANRVTGPTGAVTEYEYDARGRTIVERSFPGGTAVETRYVHGASGLLEARQTADGNTTVYHHDDARRLIQEDVTEPGGTFAVRRTTLNANSQPLKAEIGRDQ
jgi:YD repeat-containing protein